jgi:hypothetical protein
VTLTVQIATDGVALLDCTVMEAGARDQLTVEYFNPPRFVALPPPVPTTSSVPIQQWAVELLELVAAILDLPSFLSLHSTCRSPCAATFDMHADLLDLSGDMAAVTAELRRLADPERRTQPTTWSAQDRQRIARSIEARDDSPVRQDVWQRGLQPLADAIHHWAGQLSSNFWLRGTSHATSLTQMLQQAAHLPNAVLLMAVPRLANLFANASPQAGVMARFVDTLYTLDQRRAASCTTRSCCATGTCETTSSRESASCWNGRSGCCHRQTRRSAGTICRTCSVRGCPRRRVVGPAGRPRAAAPFDPWAGGFGGHVRQRGPAAGTEAACRATEPVRWAARGGSSMPRRAGGAMAFVPSVHTPPAAARRRRLAAAQAR